MRSYEKQSENKLEKVICNRCGREMKVVGGILQKEYLKLLFCGDIFQTGMGNDIPLTCVRLVMRK